MASSPKDKMVGFTPSLEDSSIIRKYTILFLVSSIIPMVLLYYVYLKSIHIGLIVMLLMIFGVLVGFLSIRSLLIKAINIAEDNRRSLRPFINTETANKLSQESNELLLLQDTFTAARKQLEDNIQELKAKNDELKTLDKIKDDFINNISHEFRMPLTIIQESINQVSEGLAGEVNEEQKHFFQMCLRNTRRLKTLIDNMLDLAKIEEGKLELIKENFNMRQVIDEVVSDIALQARKKDIALEVESPLALIVCADRDKITQVLLNLVNNAYKFTPKGFIKIRLLEKKDTIECSVEDSGVGINPEHLSRMFSKFFQISRLKGKYEKGTGLGLIISKNIIELHQGKMYVESKEGAGSKFSFTLPKTRS